VKGSWLEGRFEGADVFEGDLKISGLGIFIPYSYNVQGPSFVHREDIDPRLLELGAARPFLIDGPESLRLMMQIAGLGRPAVR
jgi:hypothetical protein